MYEEIGIYNIVLFIIMINKICLEVLFIIIIEKLKESQIYTYLKNLHRILHFQD